MTARKTRQFQFIKTDLASRDTFDFIVSFNTGTRNLAVTKESIFVVILVKPIKSNLEYVCKDLLFDKMLLIPMKVMQQNLANAWRESDDRRCVGDDRIKLKHDLAMIQQLENDVWSILELLTL